MDLITVTFLLGVCIGSEVVKASFIEAKPSTIYPSTTQTLSIECNIRPLLPAIKDVYVLQIEKSETSQSVSLASVTEHGLVQDGGFDSSRMTLAGNLSSSSQGPYIKLTINQPDDRDKGTYVCITATTDKTGTLVSLNYQTDVNIADSIPDQLMAMVANLSSEISTLREENRFLRDNFTTFQSQVQDLTNQIGGAGSNQSDLSNEITKLNQTTQLLLSDIVYTTLQYDQINDRLKLVENMTSGNNGQIISQPSANQKTLAFSYTYPDIDAAVSLVKFQFLLIDTDNSYSTITGGFIAPLDGLYLLSLHIAVNSGSLQVAIKVKQSLVAYAATTFSYGIQQGSTTTVVRMSKGDIATVKVSKVLKTPIVLQKDACSFTGVYLGTE